MSSSSRTAVPETPVFKTALVNVLFVKVCEPARVVTVPSIDNWPLEALKPVPATPATRSATDSFFEALLSLASTITILSLATSTTAAVNSLRSNANEVVAPSATEPPPESPSPAVTVTAEFDNLAFAIEPASIVFVTVPVSPEPTKVPVEVGKVRVTLPL